MYWSSLVHSFWPVFIFSFLLFDPVRKLGKKDTIRPHLGQFHLQSNPIISESILILTTSSNRTDTIENITQNFGELKLKLTLRCMEDRNMLCI